MNAYIMIFSNHIILIFHKVTYNKIHIYSPLENALLTTCQEWHWHVKLPISVCILYENEILSKLLISIRVAALCACHYQLSLVVDSGYLHFIWSGYWCNQMQIMENNILCLLCCLHLQVGNCRWKMSAIFPDCMILLAWMSASVFWKTSHVEAPRTHKTHTLVAIETLVLDSNQDCETFCLRDCTLVFKTHASKLVQTLQTAY